MRVRGMLVAVTVVAAACGSSGATTASPPPSSPASVTGTPSTESPGLSATKSPAPDLPAGVPASFDRDLPSGDVPADQLVPDGAEVTGTWYATTSTGEAIVVTWDVPGSDPTDPFAPRGLVVWRRFDDEGPPWRPVYGTAYPKSAGIYAIASVIGDVTGDGSDDALVLAETGGSGACGTYEAIDLAAAKRVFHEEVCDTQITPSADPPGLTVIEAVYAPGDPHCCPSATRTTVLTYGDDGAWHVVSKQTIPNA